MSLEIDERIANVFLLPLAVLLATAAKVVMTSFAETSVHVKVVLSVARLCSKRKLSAERRRWPRSHHSSKATSAKTCAPTSCCRLNQHAPMKFERMRKEMTHDCGDAGQQVTALSRLYLWVQLAFSRTGRIIMPIVYVNCRAHFYVYEVPRGSIICVGAKHSLLTRSEQKSRQAS